MTRCGGHPGVGVPERLAQRNGGGVDEIDKHARCRALGAALFGEQRQHRMRDITLDKRSDEHREQDGPVLDVDVDEIPQLIQVTDRRRQRHRGGQLGTQKTNRGGVGDSPSALADADHLPVGSSGIDEVSAVVVGDAQVQLLRSLVGGQAFEDQRGVGEGLAAGDSAGVAEVARGELGTQAGLAGSQQHRQVGASAVGTEGLAVFGDSEEIALSRHVDQPSGDGLPIGLCVGAQGFSCLRSFYRRV
ncbi:MAG: hypothetical protein JWM76_4318 [Pseudonocardiales bacterium]|nr:hypothetical protein [Pseudonocardiales bacterium]